jgi:beta-glucanase (GH16 family)
MGTLYSSTLVTLGRIKFQFFEKFSGQLSCALRERLFVKPGLFGALILVLICLQGSPRNAPSSASPSESNESSNEWVLSWSDEFNGPDGAAPDPAKWTVMGGGGGWGNNELQYYTADSRNVRQENGKLIIVARKENFQGPDGVRRSYTSARISTLGHFSQEYGRFEARIKVSRGQGVWPAFWLLGGDFPTRGWPACGEIDIMENVGEKPATVLGSLHGPGYFGENSLTTAYTLPRGRFSDGFHVFAVEWQPQVIRFYVDEVLFATKTPADIPAGNRWVYDHSFFILLNLAVGGNLPGSPDNSTTFPQRMLVDYVRVYTHK